MATINGVPIDQNELMDEEEIDMSTGEVMNENIDSIVSQQSASNVAGTSATQTSSSNAAADRDAKKKHYFLKELRCMLYGFGDDKQPYTETVELLEEIVVEYIKNFTLKAMEVGKAGKVQLEDVWYLIRRDPKKYGRVKDLLTMNEELRKARKAFDEAKY